MSDDLIDPTKDKWAIVEERDDGSALRNDGRELKSRLKNPWYVLATIYGELDEDSDDNLAARNRRAWNLWACQDLDEDERKELVEKTGLGEDELGGAWEIECKVILRRFRERLGADTDLPPPAGGMDFSGVYFPEYTGMSCGRYVFAYSAYFNTAHFASGADFITAHFAFGADFSSAHFAADADFTTAHFAYASFSFAHFASLADFSFAHISYDVSFSFADFASYAYFDTAHFASDADFHSAHFASGANFSSTHFASRAAFSSAHFASVADFSSATFKSATRFDEAVFQRRAPAFFAAEVYQDTSFTLDEDKWPKPEAKSARPDADAYVRLKQLMVDAHKPDDALFFLRRELRCKLLTEKKRERVWIWAFGLVSDFGYSIWRPFLGLAALITAFWLIYLVSFIWEAVLHNGARTGAEAFGLSFSNTFGFLGFNRVYFGAEYFQKLPAWIKVAGAVQTIMGIVFLFFFGLGLRNRFRLK